MTKLFDIIRLLVLIVFIDLLTSCSNEVVKEDQGDASSDLSETKDYTKETVSMREFADWCSNDDHKLKKSKDIADIRFSLSFLPPEAMAYLELRNENYDEQKFKKTIESYSAMTYFNFRIEVIEGKMELLKYQLRSPAEYEVRVRYLSFEVDNDIYLIQGKDTIHPGLLHFERIFEVAPYATLMLAFDNKKFNKDREFTVVYNDLLFEKGFVKYSYKNNQLINIPNISAL